MTPSREQKIIRVSQNRQQDMAIVLENVHDVHNIGAILRSADATGVQNVHVVYSHTHLDFERVKKTSTPSTGALKWLDVHYHRSLSECEPHLKKYDQILVSTLEAQPRSLYELDLSKPTALVFGNEHAGATPEMVDLATGTFSIPQVGMVQSLNVSVACAVTLYESMRQRISKGTHYPKTPLDPEFLNHMKQKHEDSYKK